MANLILLLNLTLVSAGQSPSFLVQFFRHGARVELYKNVDQPELNDLMAFGDLTTTGMKQHYLLGLQMRKEYSDLFPSVYDKNVHTLYCSNYNRTLVSLSSHLMGVYELGKGLEIEVDEKEFYNPPISGFDMPFEEGKNAIPRKMQLIPMKNPADDANILFGSCPYIAKRREELLENDFIYENDFNPLKEALEKAGFTPKTFNRTRDDRFFINAACDFIIARTYSQKDFKVDESLIDQCHLFSSVYLVYPVRDMQISRLSNTPIFRIIVDSLKAIGTSKEKVLTFSGHDTNVHHILSVFYPMECECVVNEYRRLYNPSRYDPSMKKNCYLQVRFTANIIIEVFEAEDKKMFVMMKLNGEELPIFQGKTTVELSQFIKALSDEIEPSFDHLCLGKKPTNKFLIQTLLATIATIVLLLILIWWIKPKPRVQTEPEYIAAN